VPNQIYRAWNISGGIAFGFWCAAVFLSLALAIVPGLILLGWGVAVGANWRGAADAFPAMYRFPGVKVRTLLVRRIFGLVAVTGVIFLIIGIEHLAR